MIEIKPIRQKKSLHLSPDEVLFWEHDGADFALRVEQDDMGEDPRNGMDNIGRMYCAHRRYDLGDYTGRNKIDMGRFFADLIEENVPAEVLAARIKNKSIEKYEPDDGIESDDDLVEDFLSAMRSEDINGIAPRAMEAMKDYAVIQPLWLYDHSGITMSVGERAYPYNDRWDSGCVGFIVVTKQDAFDNLAHLVKGPDGNPVQVWSEDKKTWHYQSEPLTDSNWEQAASDAIHAEVDAYDKYLTGDIWWFKLCSRSHSEEKKTDEDDWDEIDSCGGFYGSDIFENGIPDHAGCGLMDALKSGSYKIGRCEEHRILKRMLIMPE